MLNAVLVFGQKFSASLKEFGGGTGLPDGLFSNQKFSFR
jgi:hypothetical protein